MKRPIVVACENERKAAAYVAALVCVGVSEQRVRVFTPQSPPADGAATAAAAAGLVLCGGPDYDPSLYGEEPLAEVKLSIDPPLDRLDRELFAGARRARTPVWAICRGMQGANIFLGGSLWQDLPLQVGREVDHYVGLPLDHPAHALVRVDPRSPFGERLAAGRVEVNSRHHQAARELSPELSPVAWTADGVVEAAESRNGWWLRGVQWHPEDLMADPLQRELWLDFVAAADAHDAELARRDDRR